MTDEQYNDELKSIFIYETEEHLRTLEEILAAAEHTEVFSMEQTNELFRIMHTIKGSSAMMKLEALSQSAHRLEDLFSVIRNNMLYEDKKIVSDTISVLFAALTYFRQTVECLLAEQEIAVMPQELRHSVDLLEAKCHPEAKCHADEPVQAVPASRKPEEKPMPGAAIKQPEGKYRVLVKLQPMPLPCMRSLVVVKALKKYCSKVQSIPPELEKHPELTEQVAAEGFWLTFTPLTGITVTEVLEALQKNSYVQECFLETEEKPQAEGHDNGKNSSSDRMVSVRQSKLDSHIELLGELAITAGLLEDKLKSQGALSDEIERLLALTRKSIKGIYNSAVSMNLVEADTLLFRLRLLAREMCARQGKDVEVKCSGGKVEVDKLVLDKLYEPLMHVVRNAIDHGIETPVKRLEKGKKAQGLLIIEVSSQNDVLKITVTDDGEGIDNQKVLAKACQLGMIDGRQTELTPKEIIELLLKPGFSTSGQVTEYSGRGVGLDVVNSGLRKLGGALAINSSQGLGSCFTLTIPTSLTVMEGLEFTAGDIRLLLPVTAISKIIKLRSDCNSGWTLEKYRDDTTEIELLKSKGNSVPVLDLAEYLGVDCSEKDTGDIYMLTSNSEGQLALRVDGIGEIRNIVLKELPLVLAGLQKSDLCYAGCAVLGDGAICLLLDPGKLAV